MSDFPPLNIEAAPEKSRAILQGAQAKYGFLPNLLKVMGHAPSMLKAYATIGGIFDESSLSPAERQVVLLTVSRLNGCEYCVAAHSKIAESQRVDPAVVDAIRDDRPLADERLEALRRLTRSSVSRQGWVEREELENFYAAGFSPPQVLEVIVGIAMKTLSNYTNHIADTPLDAAFADRAWQKNAA